MSEFSLEGLDFNDDLLSDLDAIEPAPQQESEPEPEPKDNSVKGEMTAEFVVGMIEAGFKSFIHDGYELEPQKKLMIVQNFTPVLNKYDGGLIGLLGDYKEEGQALFAMAILGFSMWLSIKEMRKAKATPKESTEHGKE